MNRDLFDEIPEVEGFDRKAFVDKVMKANGDDVEKAKAKQVTDIETERDNLKTDLEKATQEIEAKDSQLKEQDETIKELKELADDSEATKKKLEEYEQKEEARKKEEEQAQIEEGFKARFNGVTDGSEFVNDFTKEAVFGKFKDAVDAPENKGKSDKEIYQELLKGNEGWLKQKQKFLDMQGMGHPDIDTGIVDKYKNMSLTEQMKWANENPEQYAEIKDLV